MGDENQAIAQQLAIDVWHEQGRQRGLREGYEQAIANLSRERYGEWWDRQDDEPPARTLGPWHLKAAADYLSARLTEETTP